MLWIPLDPWRDENPFGVDTPRLPTEWVIPTPALTMASILIFITGVLTGVMGMGIWILW